MSGVRYLECDPGPMIQVSETGLLMVCLCSDQGYKAAYGMEVCPNDHNTVTLKSLVEAGYGSLLHIQEENGKIRALTAEDFQPKQKMGREFL